MSDENTGRGAYLIEFADVGLAAGVPAGVVPDAIETMVTMKIVVVGGHPIEFVLTAEEAEALSSMLVHRAGVLRRMERGEDVRGEWRTS